MNISTIVNPVVKFGAKIGFKCKAAAPEILIALGVVGIVGTVVLAVKETPKAEEIIVDHNVRMEEIKDLRRTGEEYPGSYTTNEYGKEVFCLYANTSWKLAKNYIPAASLLVLSISSILYSHGIMSRRNLELIAAYKALEESFSTYRERIRERYGDKVDFDAAYINDHTGESVEVTNEDGSKKEAEKVSITTQASPYARFFDETNVNWEKDRASNLFFLQAQQNFANERLQVQGFLFLKDVYESLGFQKTSYGQLVGWYLGGDGDDFVDFGIFDGKNEKKRDFVNGLEPAVLIDPNVDGVIYDLI